MDIYWVRILYKYVNYLLFAGRVHGAAGHVLVYYARNDTILTVLCFAFFFLGNFLSNDFNFSPLFVCSLANVFFKTVSTIVNYRPNQSDGDNAK